MPDGPQATKTLRERAARWAIPAGAVFFAIPGLPSWGALLAGVAMALAVGNPHAALTRRVTRFLLPAGVVGLGAGMDLRAVAPSGSRSRRRRSWRSTPGCCDERFVR